MTKRQVRYAKLARIRLVNSCVHVHNVCTQYISQVGKEEMYMKLCTHEMTALLDGTTPFVPNG